MWQCYVYFLGFKGYITLKGCHFLTYQTYCHNINIEVYGQKYCDI